VTRTLIIGSGPAAAGAALALVDDPAQQITVLDVGHRLETEQAQAVTRLSGATPATWSPADLELIRMQPAARAVRGLPEKRAYGSDFPFHDAGQLDGVSGTGQVNDAVISGAYGGLSNVWGAQVMVFTPATFSNWPVDSSEMEHHYRAVLGEIPYAGEEDALARRFPLVGSAAPLPDLAPRSTMVLKAALRHDAALERSGVLVGRARLAFDAPACVRCGLCMTGCPYSLIYSSAHTFDRLRREGRIDYHDGLLAFELGQDGEVPYALARELSTGTVHRFDADRVFVAGGAFGTTRLVLGSLRLFDETIEMAESVQFVMPMASVRPTPDPRASAEFTLNQFNMAIATDEEWRDVAQIHFYPYNPAMLGGLPGILQRGPGAPLGARVLRHITVGLGYLPSWESPSVRATAHAPSGPGVLPGLELTGDVVRAGGNAMFRRVVAKIVASAPRLDLWPVLPMTYFSAGAKSYHFGGSFPHRTSPADGPLTTDRLGRLDRWSRVHLVDASVFPSVPATTFTLTIMANAHRIAHETLGLAS
jgi:choline dehydrogenase-like flavoprotein